MYDLENENFKDLRKYNLLKNWGVFNRSSREIELEIGQRLFGLSDPASVPRYCADRQAFFTLLGLLVDSKISFDLSWETDYGVNDFKGWTCDIGHSINGWFNKPEEAFVYAVGDYLQLPIEHRTIINGETGYMTEDESWEAYKTTQRALKAQGLPHSWNG